MGQNDVKSILSVISTLLGVTALVWESYGAHGLKLGRGLLLLAIFFVIFFAGAFYSFLLLEQGM